MRGRLAIAGGTLVPALVLALTVALPGCERGLHEMYDQPKYRPFIPSPLFADGNSARPAVPGTQPRCEGPAGASNSGRDCGAALETTSPEPEVIGSDGRPLSGATAYGAAARIPLPLTRELLARGRERFDIFCAPCHSRLGDGDGPIVRRGFPAPPSFHTERLRGAPDSHFYAVITHGYGLMYPYADRVAANDRWAITAYIRALQLSQHAPASDLDAADLSALGSPAR